MCYYITATLPNDDALEEVKKALIENDMKFTPITNKSIQSYLKEDQIYFRPTTTYCDCDTALGAFNRQEEYDELLQSEKVRNLRKKKWSQEQIDNWINAKLSKSKPRLKKSISPMERENEIKKWFSLLLESTSLEKVLQIGILKHWYKSSLENEEIILKRIQNVNINEIETYFLLNLEKDVLYEFHK